MTTKNNKVRDIEAYDKAMTIVNLIKEVAREYCSFGLSYYKPDGTLYFNVEVPKFADCLITPKDGGSYNIFIYKTHNMKQRTILSEIDDVKSDDLCRTLKETIEHLRSEWDKWNQPEWRGSWWGYGELQRTE